MTPSDARLASTSSEYVIYLSIRGDVLRDFKYGEGLGNLMITLGIEGTAHTLGVGIVLSLIHI